MQRAREAVVVAVVVLVALVGACSRSSGQAVEGGAPVATAPTPPSAGDLASSEPGSEELKPVYPVDAGPPDPLVQRLCAALQALPERRKAECCSTKAGPAIGIFEGQCERTLTAALHARAVTVAEDDVSRCVDAMTRDTTGCDWVTPTGPPTPPECDGIVHGMLAAGARCRSSLECPSGLRCQGLSTIDVGTCATPKATGLACNLADDMLAVFTRQSADVAHPECGGMCRSHRCSDGPRPPTPHMRPPPKPEGAACSADSECRGACVRGDAQAGGTCSAQCPVVALPSRK